MLHGEHFSQSLRAGKRAREACRREVRKDGRKVWVMMMTTSPTTRSVSKTCELNASPHDICIMSGKSPRWASYRHLPRQPQLQSICESPHVPCTALDSAGKPKHETPTQDKPSTAKDKKKATRSTSFSAKRTARCSATSQKSGRQEGNQDNKRSLRTTEGRELTDQDTRQAAIQGEHANLFNNHEHLQKDRERISLKQSKEQSVYSTQLSSTTRRAHCPRSITTRKGQTTLRGM